MKLSLLVVFAVVEEVPGVVAATGTVAGGGGRAAGVQPGHPVECPA